MALLPGTRLGRYEIVAPLGAGGMGEVYRARDDRLGREVAVKVLPEAFAGDPDRLARLEREARTVAGLNHPNIVVLHSVEEAAGVRFLTMELVEGVSLAQLVRPGGLPLERVLELAIPIAGALASAHARSVVHRDLKPGNVMVGPDGRVKVLDFGLAKAGATASALEETRSAADLAASAPGQLVGTLPYMAPEQVRGESVDARTDLFAFGVLLFELLTGRRPFEGATPADLASSILRDPPPPLGRLRPGLPAGIAALVDRCLRKEPELRTCSASDVLAELELARREPESRALSAAAAPPTLPSIAVLPFANRGGAREDEYFADGITEDVIAQLCKMRTLRVISRSSVMPFRERGEDLRTIAERLGVTNLLEGSVRRAGNRVRIVAQLLAADSGEHLWAETYDRDLTDIFAIQSDVALHIAGALQAELSHDERERIRVEPTRDLQAYELYLHGRHHLTRFTVEYMLSSLGFFERAIERDPGFALAHIGLAIAHTELGDHGARDRERSGARAIAAAMRAVALDPDLADAHCALAYARLVFEFDWSAAEAGFLRAIELSPNNADAHDLYGRMCAGLERFDEAIALQQRAHELDPLTHRVDVVTSYIRAGRNDDAVRAASAALALEPRDARLNATLGWALIRLGRTAEGVESLERAVGLAPGEDMWRAQLAEAYGLTGRAREAREILVALEDPARPAPASPYHLAFVHAGLGELDRAMDCLELAFEKRSGAMYGIKGSFLLAPLRDHPRFAALLRRMRLG